MASEKIISLGRKLLALAERGVDGEKENAQRVLKSYMEKYGLELKDIEPKTRSRRIVTNVTLDIKQMFINFVASIVGKDYDVRKCKGKGYWALEMNDDEWSQFEEQWPVYRKALKAELKKKQKEHEKMMKLVVNAFISKHDMYSKDREDSGDSKPLTPEELEEIMQMLRMREKMDDISFYKKLTA